MADPLAGDDIRQLIGTPGSVAEWKTATQGLLTAEACAFRRNVEISARYAWIYRLMPHCFKWAGMAALASHHVRLALFPLRLDADNTGRVDIERSRGRHRYLLLEDVNTIRTTNNAIFDDIYWAHLAYAFADDGIGHLRALVAAEPHYAPLLAGFEAVDAGRRVLEDPRAAAEARRAAEDLVWQGNLQLLEHEQYAMVQPNFDHLSCTFARILSMGAATSFEARSLRQEATYFTSFYGYSLLRGGPRVVRTRSWPRFTRYDDRWCWLAASVVPHFRAFESDRHKVEPIVRRILGAARAAVTCVQPGPPGYGCPCQFISS